MLILVSELCFRLPYCLFKCVILIIYINAFVRQIRHCFFQIFFCSRFQYILYIFILRQFHFRGRFIFSAESIVHHFHTFNCKFSNDLILFLFECKLFYPPNYPNYKVCHSNRYYQDNNDYEILRQEVANILGSVLQNHQICFPQNTVLHMTVLRQKVNPHSPCNERHVLANVLGQPRESH